jgi:hypothetical protein
VSTSNRFSREALCLLLAAAHLLVVTHSAFVTHAISSTGEHHHVIEGASHVRHAGLTGTWCGEHVELKPVDDLACTAAKLANVSTLLRAEAVALSAAVCLGDDAPAFRFARNPLSVLMCSPKASPPGLVG